MTPQQFSATLAEERLRIFGMMRQIAEADPQYLKALGHGGRSNAEALLQYFLSADRALEKKILAFEKAHQK